MKTAEAMAKKLETLGALRNIVRTMKALSSANVRQYEHAVDALGDYYRTIELGLHVVLTKLPPPRPQPSMHRVSVRLAAVVFGTDYGLCGRFNQTLCEHALQSLESQDVPKAGRLFLAVGGKAAAGLEATGQSVRECLFTPGSAEGIIETVAHLLLKIDEWKEEEDVEQVWLFYNRRTGQTCYQPMALNLLPLDIGCFHYTAETSWPTRVLPTFSMPADELLASLVRQYLFVALSRASAESLASEHNARLIAMQAAEKNIGEALEETRAQHRQLRQEAITAEILEVVSGYQTISLH